MPPPSHMALLAAIRPRAHPHLRPRASARAPQHAVRLTGLTVKLMTARFAPRRVPPASSDGAAAAARDALASGAPVICDAQMVADGVIAARLPADNQILSMIRLPNVAAMAKEQGTTRSAAQVELWKPFLPGSVVAIGNAPTALFRLLEVIAEDPSRAPAAHVFSTDGMSFFA